ncbi:SPOR domain-containing protein [Thiocapsa sp.]|uniref:SPOR domain-containing protein n=1 Tax=Thiocapsa sp. TaxID=2024551 RepID=UPI003593682A
MDNTPDTADLAAQIASLSDTVARHRLEFQAAENALVTRIADVDDDRRLTTNRLQRAWQTHRDEIDARLKRQASVFVGTLLLIAVLLGVALLVAYGQLDTARRTLLEEVSRLRVDYEQLAAVATRDATLQESVANLRASVAILSESLPPSTAPVDMPAPAAGADDSRASAVGEITSTVSEAEPEPESEPSAEPVSEPSTPVAGINDTATLQPPEDLVGQEIEPTFGTAPEPVQEPEETPTAAPTHDTAPEVDEIGAQAAVGGTAETQGPLVSIADEPLIVGVQPYALQLIGFYSLEDMLDFARREQLPARVYFREESYQGRPWFVVIHSLHPRYSDASESIDKLPPELAMLDTWIRNFPPETRLGILDIKR